MSGAGRGCQAYLEEITRTISNSEWINVNYFPPCCKEKLARDEAAHAWLAVFIHCFDHHIAHEDYLRLSVNTVVSAWRSWLRPTWGMRVSTVFCHHRLTANLIVSYQHCVGSPKRLSSINIQETKDILLIECYICDIATSFTGKSNLELQQN